MNERELLEELRAYVVQAVSEIERLRRNNKELMSQINSLKISGESSNGSGLIENGHDSEELKEKIQHFMDTIDAFLESPASS